MDTKKYWERRFELTADHIKLIRRMNVGWQSCEAGAPEIDPKRPYGNSCMVGDVAEILGWEVDEDEGLTDAQRERAEAIHLPTGRGRKAGAGWVGAWQKSWAGKSMKTRGLRTRSESGPKLFTFRRRRRFRWSS